MIETNLVLFQDQIGQIAKISEDFTQKNIQIDASVTTLLPRIEKMESYLREKMATLRRTKAMSHDPFLCYFEGIDRMILKYVPGAYRTFKHHGPIKFGNAPAGYNNDCMARHFVSWYSSAEDSDTGPGWYQGEVDDKNWPDGRGVFISPNSLVMIGYFSQETGAGEGIQIAGDGSKLVGTWRDNAPWDVNIYKPN